MHIFRGQGSAKQLRRNFGVLPARLHLALDPNLVYFFVSPVREQADTVATGHDRQEMVFQFLQGEIPVNHLFHLKGRLQVQRQLRDDSQGTQSHYCPVKFFAIFPRQSHHLSRRIHHLHSRNPRGQVPVPDA